MQAVFDLPKKLKAALDMKAYGVAADMYAEVLPLLKSHGNKASWSSAFCHGHFLGRTHPTAVFFVNLQGAFRRVKDEIEVCAQLVLKACRTELASLPEDLSEVVENLRKLDVPEIEIQVRTACWAREVLRVIATA